MMNNPPARRSCSIRTSLSVIVLLAILPAMVIIAVTGQESKKHAEADARAKALSMARGLGAMQNRLTNEARVLLSALTQNDVIVNKDVAACNQLFASLIKVHSGFFNIVLADTDGTILASGNPRLVGVNVSDREYFKSALADRSFAISGFTAGITTRSPLQVFALPVSKADGSVGGVVMLAVLNDTYIDFISDYMMPPGSRVTFVDSKGIRQLSYPEHELYPAGQHFYHALWDMVTDSAVDEWNHSGNRLSGEKVLFTFLRLRLTPSSPPYMTIVTSTLENEVFKDANALLFRNAVLVMISAVLALGITWLIGDAAILRSLRSLMKATSRLASGDLTAHADPHQGCIEMRQLASTFNGMAQALKIRQEELTESAEALNHMRNMLNNMLESMPSAIIGLNNDERVTHWNRGAEKLCGLPAEAAVGLLLAEAFPWLAEKMAQEGFSVHERAPVSMERCPFPVGEDGRFVDVLLYPLVAEGVIGAVVRIDDISRRVQMEEMIKQSERMSIMGSLAAGMAHDINNPLAGILQSIQVIKRRLSPDVQANIQAARSLNCDLGAVRAYLGSRNIIGFLESIKASGERATDIVKNMLGFIRKRAPEYAPVSLSDLMDSTLDIAAADFDLMRQYDFKNIEIVREYAAGKVLVPCSATEVQQVIYNLLGNAAQAMAGHPNPAHPPKLILRVYGDELHGVVEIEDNGPGMSEEVRKRVFEPMFSTKTPGEGCGLGLSIAYFIIVNTYRGEIQVKSAEGRGTSFVVRIPLEAKSAKLAPGPRQGLA